MPRLPFVVLALLLACGPEAAPSDDAGVSGASNLLADPCALVTVEEVESATASTVVSSGLVPDERLRFPEDPKPCEYVTDGQHEAISVYVHPHDASDFTRLRDEDPRNTDTIEGVGDDAYAHGLASLTVRVGDGYFVLVTQHGAGWAGIRDLKKLALAALD